MDHRTTITSSVSQNGARPNLVQECTYMIFYQILLDGPTALLYDTAF
jgi:hypothetical protein